MKVRKAIKKIMALSTGAFMLGATMLSSVAAADLANYPSPFVKDGVFSGMLVVGDDAKGEDIIGITNIALSLQQAAVKKVPVDTSSTVTVEGDAVKVEESTNKLEMGEQIDDIQTSVTSADLSALADGTLSNEHGTFKYTQVIDLPAAKVLWANDPNDASDEYKDYLVLNGSNAYTYKISFTPALKTDHRTVSSGTAYLDDIRDKKLTLLGKEWTILKADHTDQNNTALTLMGGAVSDIIEEGETKTYTLKGTDYEITASYISSTEVKFTVNGDVTDSLQETETYRIGSVEIGVVDIMENEAGEAAGGDKVQFNLGANKIKIADTATQTANSGCTVTLGTDESSNVKCNIITSSDAGTTNGADVYISSIEVWYTPSEDLYVAAGGIASEKADEAEDEVGVFFMDAFDYKYEGLTMTNTEEVKIRAANNENYKLTFTNRGGTTYNEYVYSTTGTTASTEELALGKYSGSSRKDLVISETEAIADEEYFVVNKNKYSRLLQFKDVSPGSSTSDNSGTIKVKDLGTAGDTIEVSYASLTGNLILDGNTYQINVSSDTSSADLYVDMNGDGDLTDTNAAGFDLYTKNEAIITLAPDGNETLFSIQTPEDEDNNRDNVTIAFITNSDKEADIASASLYGGVSGWPYRQGDSYVYEGYTYKEDATSSQPQFGMFVQWDKKSSGTDQDDVTFTIPKTQTTANFFVTSGAVTTVESAGGATSDSIQEIDVGVVKLAAEVSNAAAQNLILVGGPCANSVVREIMAATQANCAAGFQAGKAMIKLYEQTGGKVALVVAGGEAVDTRRAALVIANYKDYADDLTGEEVAVTTVTSTPTVAQPVVPEPEPTE